MKLVKITKNEGKRKTCDIEVDHPDHPFYANGISVHNSATKIIFTGQTPEMKATNTFEIQNAKSRNSPLFDPIKMLQDPNSGLFHDNIATITKEETVDIIDSLEI